MIAEVTAVVMVGPVLIVGPFLVFFTYLRSTDLRSVTHKVEAVRNGRYVCVCVCVVCREIEGESEGGSVGRR